MKNKNIKVKVVGNDDMDSIIEVKEFNGYEMLKVVVDKEEGEGEMDKERFKEDYKVVKENKDCIKVYDKVWDNWIEFIKV
jgi:hypothetical protein